MNAVSAPHPLSLDDSGSLRFQLLNNFQRDFPLVARPFAELAQRLDVDEPTVIEALQALREHGVVSRIGAVFRPNVVGVSALAALAVPPERLEAVAAQVSARSEVNHNYQREHRLNLWFVVTAATPAHLSAVFQALQDACGCGPVLVLPLLEQFHIDLGFCLNQTRRTPMARTQAVAAITLSDTEQQLVARLQHGIDVVPEPFAALGWPQDEALDLLTRWTGSGVISRFGVVVRHHELGFHANAMVVWNIPDEHVSQVGHALAQSGLVSLCYRRPRVLPHWPYNLFCMLHGKDRDEVAQRLAQLKARTHLQNTPSEVLFSCKRFKQTGARYVNHAMPTRTD